MRTPAEKWRGTAVAPDGPLPRWLTRVLAMATPACLARRWLRFAEPRGLVP